jgi:hypothetical protein
MSYISESVVLYNVADYSFDDAASEIKSECSSSAEVQEGSNEDDEKLLNDIECENIMQQKTERTVILAAVPEQTE